MRGVVPDPRCGVAKFAADGMAFDFGEPGVLDGATAKSLAAGRHGSEQVGQIVKTKPLRRSCLRIMEEPGATRARSSSNRPLEQPGTITGLSQGWA